MPALRFKDKDGQAFEAPDELTIQDLFDKVKTTNKDGANKNVITNSAEHGLIPQREFFDKDIAVEGNTSKYTIIKDGDFVYNPRKSSTAPYGPFNCYTREEPGIVSPLYSCLTPKNKSYTPYLLYYFASPAWYSYIYHNGNQGGARHDRVGMTDDLLQGIPVLLPCQEEQDIIIAFLSLYDKRIEAQTSKVEALETRRKGLLQQIFSQEIRFKADDGSDYESWDELTIADLFTKVKTTNKDGTVTNVITNSAVEGLIPQRDFFEKDIAVEGNTDKYTIIHKGDFVYNPRKSTSAPYGPFNCYRLDEPGIVSPLYSCLKPNDERYTPYLLYYFASPAWYSYIYHNGNQGGARHDRVGMTDDLLMGIPVSLPCMEEQEKISQLFACIDTQIQLEKDKLEAIKQVKKGLLQQMFM